MKQITAIDLMEELRHAGWLVVLKCLPKGIKWLIEGSRSEYDAPCPDSIVGKGKWCCEAWWNNEGEFRHSETAMEESPDEAVRMVYFAVMAQAERRKAVELHRFEIESRKAIKDSKLRAKA